MEYVLSVLILILGGIAGVFFYSKKNDIKQNELERLNKESKSSLSNLIEDSKNQLNEEKIKNGKLEAVHSSNKELIESLEKKLTTVTNEVEILRKNNVELVTKLSGSDEKFNQLKNDSDLKFREQGQHVQRLTDENKIFASRIAAMGEQEPLMIQKYHNQMESLNRLIDMQKEDQKGRVEALELEVQSKARELKETWARHEKDVEDKMRLICQQESVDYIDKEKYPFKGKPDNCVKICDEYIIFDSKSPQGEDLSNLPQYIKSQAEAAIKYSKQDGVKKDIFLVVPTNSISVIKDTHIGLGQYDVHVITPESIRPIMIQLKKIEEYEFAEQLSPEDRNQIAKTIGRMAHGIKRNVQVSQFMNKELISILLDAEKLPGQILEDAIEKEKEMKLNPPTEKRAKAIKIEALVDESGNMDGKLLGQDIYNGAELKAIESIPLSNNQKKA